MTESGQPTQNDEKHQLLSARRLITFANIAGPVSLIIGGVALSTAALVCALIARSKINKLLQRCNPAQTAFQQEIMSATKPGAVAIVISAIALVLNTISIAIMMPILLNAMQSGDMTGFLGGGGSAAVGSATSTWG